MPLTLQNSALTVPDGTEFPGTFQALLDLVAEYMAIVGGEDFSGVNYGDTEPEPDNRDRPWFKTDESGNPIGWYGWNGSAWVPIPVILPSGTTAERPVSPDDGTQFFDTTINVALIYYDGQWRTVSGSPGDVKFVTETDLFTALEKNPGWSQYAEGIGRVLAGASDGTNAGEEAGNDEITLTIPQLPSHTHTTQGNYGSGGEGGSDNPLYYDAAQAPLSLQAWAPTGSTGSGEGIDIRQQTKYLFSLVKN